MRAGQEFIDFPKSETNAQLARIIRPQEPNSRARLLRVPLFLRHGFQILLVDMRNAHASGSRLPSRNACLNLPSLSIHPHMLDPDNLDFKGLVSSRVFQPGGVLKIESLAESNNRRSTRALGVYKDYPLVCSGVDTVVTALPAVMVFKSSGAAPEAQYDYRKIRGETTWTPIEDAAAQLTAQAEEMPDNNLAQDAAALVELAAVRVFHLPVTIGV